MELAPLTPAPQIDHLVPFFHLVDSKGHTFTPDTLLGQPYVLYFYPKDDTPGCSTQACQFRDLKPETDKLKALIIGISPDSSTSHDQFIAKYSLNFSLVPDPDHTLCTLFKVWGEKKNFGKVYMGVTRTTFVVDTKGIIRWIEAPIQLEGHAERVLQALKNLPKNN